MGNVTADRAWDVHPVTEADIEAYLDIYLNSYPAYKALDEECRAHYRSKHLTELREDTQTRTMGLFEGGTLIATMKLILFSMNFFGVMQPACGVMALEVHPLHKKKGAALYMIRYAERYARENGALLTMLLPFNIGFYRRMGYGFGGKHCRGWTERCGRTCACCSRRSLTRRWTASGALPPETMAWWRSSTRSCAEPGGIFRCAVWVITTADAC